MADDYVLNYVTPNRFYVEVEGEVSAYFSECSGLGSKVKKNVYMEGGVNDQQRIYLGQTTFTDVILKRGLTNNIGFWNWAQRAMGTEAIRRNITILTFNQAGETMQSWTLIGAVPIAWKAPILKADGATIAIEQLTLAYEGLKVVSKKDGASIPVQRHEKSQFFL